MSTAPQPSKGLINSTNDRTYQVVPRPVVQGFRGLAGVWPAQAERLAAWLFCHPHRAALRHRDAVVLETGSPFRLGGGSRGPKAWSWGEGPTVLLHHGWSGRAAQMSAFVQPLVDRGFHVVAYDAPAHGASPGRSTGLPVLADALGEYAARQPIHAIIAHSVGCAAVMLAIQRGLSIERGVFLAPPSDMRAYLALFADQLGLDDRIRQGMARRIASRFRIDWAEMDVKHWSRTQRPPLLLFHDRGDRIVPREQVFAIQDVWENAALVETDGLGHQGIRRNPGVVERAVEFLQAGPAARKSTEEFVQRPQDILQGMLPGQ